MVEQISRTGVDGWVSSSYHEDSERVEDEGGNREVYAHWANSYEEEMLVNDLQSYKSVTRVAMELISAEESPVASGNLRVIDAGCGTGLLGQHFLEVFRASGLGPCSVYLAGVDLSPDMLLEAEKKGCFDDLQECSLRAMQETSASNFDLLLSAGVFLAGHCGAESVGPMLSCLETKGYAVFTVRSSLFQEQEADFLAAITNAGCELLKASVMPYYGEIEAHVLVVQKQSPVTEEDAQGDWRQEYKTRGFAQTPLNANPSELAEIKDYVASRVREEHPGNVLDGEGNLRAVHGYEAGLIPMLMEKLAGLAKKLLGCPSVYLYQFRVNPKYPSLQGAGGWSPHRDYDFWQNMDGMPLPQAVVFHILLTDQTHDNGAVVLCDGSHNISVDLNVLDNEDWRGGFGEDLNFTIAGETFDTWPKKTLMTGIVGDIIAMSPLTWHASSPNRTDKERVVASIVFNDYENRPNLPKDAEMRPDFIMHRSTQYAW